MPWYQALADYATAKKCHKTHIGWYSGMVVPISSIIGTLILYSQNVLRRSVKAK